MDIDEAIDYLNKPYIKTNYNNKKNLILKILSMLDNPHKKFKAIHVAGTNGKGSVSTLISYALSNNNLKVGLFTSPHLIKYNERIKINNIDINDSDFIKIINKIKTIEAENNNLEYLSFFDILTIASFIYFSENKVDVAVIEVGIGGLYDTTNVLLDKILHIITGVSMDHTNMLGSKLEDIALQKAGIVTSNAPLVAQYQDINLHNIYDMVCTSTKTKLYYLDKSDISYNINEMSFNGTKFSIANKYCTYNNVEIKLLGTHQIINTILVLVSLEILKNTFNLKEKLILTGLASSKIDARLEIVNNKPLTIIDAAHNSDGIKNLIKQISFYLEPNKTIVIFGVLEDKDYKDMIKQFVNKQYTLVFTTINNQKAVSASILHDYCISILGNSYVINNNIKAYNFAINKTLDDTNDFKHIIICGSFYLLGDLKKYMSNKV